MSTNILANQNFPEFISYFIFHDGLEPILLLQLGHRKELLQDVLSSSVINDSDSDDSVSHLAASDFEIVQGNLFYFLMLLKDFAGLDGGTGVANLRVKIITIKER
jgi:hypothetical protein